MRKFLVGIPWLVALVACVAAGSLYVRGRHQADEIAESRTTLARTNAELERLSALTEAQEKTAEALEARLAELQEQIEAAEAAEAEAEEPGPSESEPVAMGDIFAALAGKISDPDMAEEDAPPLAAFMKAFTGESGKEMADMAADVALNYQMADLFDMLHLSPQKAQQVRDILKAHMSKMITQSAEMMQDGTAMEGLQGLEEEGNASLREELASVLTEGEMKVYDEFEETLPERTLRRAYATQLDTFAPQLDSELRQRAEDVLVEELLASGAAGTPSMGVPGDLAGNPFQQQRDALLSAQERLRAEFGEEQLAGLDGFFSQNDAILQMSERMMGAMSDQAGDVDEP